MLCVLNLILARNACKKPILPSGAATSDRLERPISRWAIPVYQTRYVIRRPIACICCRNIRHDWCSKLVRITPLTIARIIRSQCAAVGAIIVITLGEYIAFTAEARAKPVAIEANPTTLSTCWGCLTRNQVLAHQMSWLNVLGAMVNSLPKANNIPTGQVKAPLTYPLKPL
jgi:hypothetical protein